VVGEWDEAAWEREYEAIIAKAKAGIAERDRWGITGYKAHQTHDGVAFAARITDAGKVVGWIEDEGRGGGPIIYWDDVRSASAKAWDQMVEDLFPGDGMGGEHLIEALLQQEGK
jgi:hypothetical protein